MATESDRNQAIRVLSTLLQNSGMSQENADSFAAQSVDEAIRRGKNHVAGAPDGDEQPS